MKNFQSHDFTCLKELIGKSLKDIFYQPVAGILAYVDMFVVNFGHEEIEMSFHVFSFYRVISNNNILLTSSDCFFDKNFERLTQKKEDRARNNLYKGTLLSSNIERVKKLLKNAKVSNAYSTNVGDVIIEFDNSVTMEIFIDAVCDQECYRLINYTENSSQHHIVEYKDGKLFYDIHSD